MPCQAENPPPLWRSALPGAVLIQEFAQARLDILADRVPDEVVRTAETADRAVVGEAGLLHDDGRFHVPMGAAQQLVGLVVLEAGHDRDNSPGPVAELL